MITLVAHTDTGYTGYVIYGYAHKCWTYMIPVVCTDTGYTGYINANDRHMHVHILVMLVIYTNTVSL